MTGACCRGGERRGCTVHAGVSGRLVVPGVVVDVRPDDRMSTLTRHHVTAFVDPAVSEPVEELRRRWDPQMARQIAAHVTVVYPEEIPDPASLEERAAAAAATTTPFDLESGPAFTTGPPPAASSSKSMTLTAGSGRSGLPPYLLAARSASRRTSRSCTRAPPDWASRPGPSWQPAASASGSP